MKILVLILVRMDGPGLDDRGFAWTARGGPPNLDVILGEVDHEQILLALESGKDRVERCVRCKARVVLLAKRDGEEWEVAPPVDDLVCDLC